jgi:hypothetical protein
MARLKKLSNAPWDVIGEMIPVVYERRKGPDSRKLFNAMLLILHRKKSLTKLLHDEKSPKKHDKSIPVTRFNLMEKLWFWAEEKKLEPAWTAYLKSLPAKEFRDWKQKLDVYSNSWKKRTDARTWATLAHSLWFKQLENALTSEVMRRKHKKSRKYYLNRE